MGEGGWLDEAIRMVGSPSPGKARELMRNAKTYDKHISERETSGRERTGSGGKRGRLEKRGCSGGSRIMGFSYFRP